MHRVKINTGATNKQHIIKNYKKKQPNMSPTSGPCTIISSIHENKTVDGTMTMRAHKTMTPQIFNNKRPINLK